MTCLGKAQLFWADKTGYNKGANQSGMQMGGVRHVADIRADGMTKDGAQVLSLQTGTNKFASQKGMSFGGCATCCRHSC